MPKRITTIAAALGLGISTLATTVPTFADTYQYTSISELAEIHAEYAADMESCGTYNPSDTAFVRCRDNLASTYYNKYSGKFLALEKLDKSEVRMGVTAFNPLANTIRFYVDETRAFKDYPVILENLIIFWADRTASPNPYWNNDAAWAFVDAAINGTELPSGYHILYQGKRGEEGWLPTNTENRIVITDDSEKEFLKDSSVQSFFIMGYDSNGNKRLEKTNLLGCKNKDFSDGSECRMWYGNNSKTAAYEMMKSDPIPEDIPLIEQNKILKRIKAAEAAARAAEARAAEAEIRAMEAEEAVWRAEEELREAESRAAETRTIAEEAITKANQAESTANGIIAQAREAIETAKAALDAANASSEDITEFTQYIEGIIRNAESAITEAEQSVKTANETASIAMELAESAQSAADMAKAQADKTKNQADAAKNQANQAKIEAEAARIVAEQANTTAEQANAKAEQANIAAERASTQANQATAQATEAAEQANQANQQSGQAKLDATEAKLAAEQASMQANEAEQKALTAVQTVEENRANISLAQEDALKAHQTASSAAETAQSAVSQVSNLTEEIKATLARTEALLANNTQVTTVIGRTVNPAPTLQENNSSVLEKTEQTQETTDNYVELPLSGANSREEKDGVFPWWLIVFVFAGIGLVLWWLVAAKRKSEKK